MLKYNKMKFTKGLTFLEIVISLSIFAVALVGLLQIVNTALNSSYRAGQEIIGTNIASGLLAEIMSKNFVDPDNPTNPLGPDPLVPTETRNGGVNAFDDVDDYNGYTESPPLTEDNRVMDGTEDLPNCAKFTRSVTVTYCDISGTNDITDVVGPTNYKHIKVTVIGPYLRSVIIHGVKEQAP